MTISTASSVSILCAGPGLGFYVPGVIVQKQLARRNIPAEVHVFESLLTEDKKGNLPRAKASFHRNFSFALMGQQMVKDPSPYLDEPATETLLRNWKTENRTHFIVFSGFWIPVLERYLALCPEKPDIELCHVDSANSSSWSLFDTSASYYKHIWFNNWEHRSISFFLDVAGFDPVPYSHRDPSYMVHGGGWGMGTYKEKVKELNRMKLKLDVLAYELKDLEEADPVNRYYMIDPDWHAWERGADGKYGFPPLGIVQEQSATQYINNKEYPELYRYISKKKAIISKPGAGTLIDSLSSSTPLICLEPFGGYENKNSQLWQHYGLGLSFSDWMESGCSDELLQDCHKNLLKVRASTPEYVNTYINKLSHGT